MICLAVKCIGDLKWFPFPSNDSIQHVMATVNVEHNGISF